MQTFCEVQCTRGGVGKERGKEKEIVFCEERERQIQRGMCVCGEIIYKGMLIIEFALV